MLCTGCGRPSAKAAETQPTTTTTVSKPGLPSYSWERVNSPALEIGGGATSTLTGLLPPSAGRGWMITGTTYQPSAGPRADIWTSHAADASSWSPTLLALPPGADSSSANSATTWGQTRLVVGSVGRGSGRKATVWISSSAGAAFVPVELTTDTSASPSEQSSTSSTDGSTLDVVAAGTLGVFAAGASNGLPMIWYSTDAKHWSELTGATGLVDSTPGAVINTMLATTGGMWAGGSWRNGDRTSAGLWSSTDGIHWNPVTSAASSFAGDGNRVITSLLAIPARAEGGIQTTTSMLAVGGMQLGATWQPVSWISPNGLSWSEGSQDLPVVKDPQDVAGSVVSAATASSAGLTAVGNSASSTQVWQSHDGQSWSSLKAPSQAAHLGLVATSGTTTVAVDNLPGQPKVFAFNGTTWSTPDQTPDWSASYQSVFGTPLTIASPASMINDNGQLLLSVNVEGEPGQPSLPSVSLLHSTDGKTWSPVTKNPISDANFSSLLASPAGLVAAGSSSIIATSMPGTASPVATTWTSDDGGASWKEQTLPTLTPSGINSIGNSSALALTRLGSTVIAVGVVGDQAVEWHNQNQTSWSNAAPLDASPSLGIERPVTACAGSNSVVAVGWTTGTSRGKQAMAWTSAQGTSWQMSTVESDTSSGDYSAMIGCLWTGNGFIAYGKTTNANGTVQPAIWRSADGTTWTEQPASSFSTNSGLQTPQTITLAGAGVLNDVAYGGTTWLGVGPATSAAKGLTWSNDPAATALDDPLVFDQFAGGESNDVPGPLFGQAAAFPTGLGMWESGDAGASWHRLSAQEISTQSSSSATASNAGLAGTSFYGDLWAAADVAAYVGTTPIVAGSVDGQLAIWAGNPPQL